MSLMKSLKLIYVINVMLGLITAVSLVPIAQREGNEIDAPFLIAIVKLTEIIVTATLLRKVIFVKKHLKINSRLVYAC